MAPEREPSNFVVEPLGLTHDRAHFSSGIQSLDIYLRTQARQDLKKGVAAPFVITNDGKTIAGYYTLSQFAVELEVLPEGIARKLPRYPMVPATLLGRLAVASAYRGRGLGRSLLMDALRRSYQLSKEVASAVVIVDAKDDSAMSFYRKYGFLALPKIERRLFLPMRTIQQMFPGAP